MKTVTADQLKAWREDRNLSQSKLADLLGVHWMTVGAWERGRQAIPPFLELALAELHRQLNTKTTRRR